MHPYISATEDNEKEIASKYLEKIEVDEVTKGLLALLNHQIPNAIIQSVDYDEVTRSILVDVRIKWHDYKKSAKLGKLSEIKTYINRVVGGAISPHILSTNMRLIVDMSYKKYNLFLKSERILNCTVHNSRFEFMNYVHD